MTASRIESVRIRGFRSLADVELSNLRNANVLIGANGSGKSNFVRFFEMLSWMLRARRLEEFVALQGGADDQLHKGNRVTSRLEAELAVRTEANRNDYRFALAHAHPDRFVFTEEAYRYSRIGDPTTASWLYAPSGQSEAAIVDLAQTQTPPSPDVNPTIARVVVRLLKDCAVYQFHDTSDTSQIIVATQSPLLVDAFDLEDIVVLDLEDGRTKIRRPDADGYRRWLDEGFMPGEIWQKNVIGGRP